MIYVPDVGTKVDLDSLDNLNRPVIVYRRDAANKLLAQGFRIISVEKNLKRDGDTSIFLFDPENGKTLKALQTVLQEIKVEKIERERLKKINSI